MTIPLNTIQSIFSEGGFSANHRVLIQNGPEYKVVSKSDPEAKDRVPLHRLLASLSKQINSDPNEALKMTRYFIIRLKRAPSNYRQLIIDLFGKIRNWWAGIGFKTNLQFAQEIQSQLMQKTKPVEFPKGFVAEDFDTSLAKGQDQPNHPAYASDPYIQKVKKSFDLFCGKMVQKGEVDLAKPPEHSSIPPMIHFIWIGSSIPKKVEAVIQSWKALHPGWTVKVWKDGDIHSFPWEPKQRAAFDLALKAKCWAEAADVWRYNILYQHGGIYSDTDIYCYKSFNPLISSGITFFAGQETNRLHPWEGNKDPLFVCNALIGAEKGNRVIKHCLDSLVPRSHSKYPSAPKNDILSRTGPILLTRSIQKELDGKTPDDILILPCSYIYSLPGFADGKHLRMTQDEILKDYRYPESQCVHFFDGSWI